jgi:predicted GNAT family acetyltransferase
MIRKLKKDDHESVIALIGHKPAENLFIIGDIEAYGYDSKFQEIWRAISKRKIDCCLIKIRPKMDILLNSLFLNYTQFHLLIFGPE